jgi:hypothetical protein
LAIIINIVTDVHLSQSQNIAICKFGIKIWWFIWTNLFGVDFKVVSEFFGLTLWSVWVLSGSDQCPRITVFLLGLCSLLSVILQTCSQFKITWFSGYWIHIRALLILLGMPNVLTLLEKKLCGLPLTMVLLWLGWSHTGMFVITMACFWRIWRNEWDEKCSFSFSEEEEIISPR